MRCVLMLLAAVIAAGMARAQDDAKPVTPEEALKKVDEKIILLMEVKSTGGRTARYLNSETNFQSEKNFTIFIPENALAKFHKADIEEPAQYYKGKTVQVTGTVTLSGSKASSGKPQIRVDDPAQIKVIDKQAEEAKTKTPPKAVKGKGKPRK